MCTSKGCMVTVIEAIKFNKHSMSSRYKLRGFYCKKLIIRLQCVCLLLRGLTNFWNCLAIKVCIAIELTTWYPFKLLLKNEIFIARGQGWLCSAYPLWNYTFVTGCHGEGMLILPYYHNNHYLLSHFVLNFWLSFEVYLLYFSRLSYPILLCLISCHLSFCFLFPFFVIIVFCLFLFSLLRWWLSINVNRNNNYHWFFSFHSLPSSWPYIYLHFIDLSFVFVSLTFCSPILLVSFPFVLYYIYR